MNPRGGLEPGQKTYELPEFPTIWERELKNINKEL